MYERVGRYDGNLPILVELIHRLNPSPTLPLLYQTTEPVQTEALYRPYLAETFPGSWRKCFVSIVWPNGSIMAHRDLDMNLSNRFHLVLKSNSDCWVMHDGVAQQLSEGGIYKMDERQTHAAMNWGRDFRMHFVVDIEE